MGQLLAASGETYAAMVPTLQYTVLDYTFENTIYFTENKIIHPSSLLVEAAGPSGMFIHFCHMTQTHIPMTAIFKITHFSNRKVTRLIT
jgi:hypothetical protein